MDDTQDLLHDLHFLHRVAEGAQPVDEVHDAHGEGVEGLAVVELDPLEFLAQPLRRGLLDEISSDAHGAHRVPRVFGHAVHCERAHHLGGN